MATKKETIKAYRQEIADLTDHNLSAELYDRFNAEEDFTDKEKQTLHVELSTKVNELKQALHDEADAKGDKAAAAAAIAPPAPEKDAKGKELKKPLFKTEAERMEEHKEKPIHVPEGCKAKEITAKELNAINQDPKQAAKLVGIRPINPPTKIDAEGNPTKIEKYVAIMKAAVMALFIALGMAGSGMAAVSSTDEAVLGNSRWRVNSDGAFVPATTNTYAIGTTTDYPSEICLSGNCKSSWATIVSPWEESAGTTFLTSAPTKFIATHSSGDLFATGFTVGTGDFTGANGAKLDFDTSNEIRLIENSDTLKIGFSGNDITLDSTDGGVIFALTDATDGTVDFMTNNDTDDYLQISTVSNVPTIVTAGTSNLVIAPDGGTTTVTGALTATSLITGAGVTTSSTITLQNSETIVNSTNGTVTVGGATNPILNVLDAGTSDSDAYLSLSADAAADNGDVWRFNSDGATNSLFFENNTSGSQATILTLSTAGLLTTTGDAVIAGTTPTVTIGDAGEEDTRLLFDGNAQDFHIGLDDSADDLIIGLGSTLGTTPIISMSDVGHTIVTGSTDGILTVYGAGTTASDAYLRLVGDAQTDASDAVQFMMDSSAAALLLGFDSTTPGTYVTVTTFNASGDITMGGTTPYLSIGDAGAEDAGIVFDGNAQDFNISLDDTTDDLVIGLGAAGGTTDAIRIDENQVVTFVQDVRGLGTDDLSGFLQTQTAATTASITAAQCGGTFIGDSADVTVLPEASTVPGCRYTFLHTTTDDWDIDPADTTDHFGQMTASGGTIDGAAGDEYRLTDVGTSMTIEACTADIWCVVAHNGAITDVN